MIRVTILYPKKDGARFDMEYYRKVHAPLALARMAEGIISSTIDTPIQEPSLPAPLFVAAGHYLSESVSDFMKAYDPHALELQEDVKNYTDIVPIVQISEVHSVLRAPPA